MTYQELINDPTYKLHHIASKREYVSRKVDAYIRPYKGKFGIGYVALLPRWDTTMYCWIAYYVEKEN